MKKNCKNVVVTGGAGFIGSHLVEKLLNQGHFVTVLDNLSTGRRENLFDHENNVFVETDICDVKNIQSYFEGVDWVFHLAALADIVPSIQKPLDYHRVNVDGTVSVLEASRRAKVKKFIYTASSSCYGFSTLFPTPEFANVDLMYPYALTKYVGEQYALHWYKTYKLPVTSLRLFNVFGPRGRTSGTYGAVFGVFLAQKLAEEPLTVVGDGKQTRDFIYVEDVVQAYIQAAKSSDGGGIYNVGSGKTHSINYLVSLLGGDVTYLPKRPGEPDCTFADISKIKRSLAWEPKISFEEGVKKMIQSIKQWQFAPVWNKESIHHATKDWFTYLS